ncbi:MAG: class I SAM-dependent RNA methyltransferase [Alphaproteobacteria bacterium]|nr:class I SAM-dependent RNA methyltransferase [Alphaproteobacteria bacterium]
MAVNSRARATNPAMRRPVSRDGDGTTVELVVETLGAGGDGVARLDGEPVYVPWTLPGERVEARRVGADRAVPIAWRHSAPDRAAPACPHFTKCGGCTLQHLPQTAYAEWKLARVREAVARAGCDPAVVGALQVSPPRTRRRASFAAIRTLQGVVLGFHAPMSRDIVAITDCAVVDPALAALLPPLRQGLGDVLDTGQRCDVAVTATASGLDVLVIGPVAAARLSNLANALDLARLSLAREPGASAELIALRRAPEIRFDGVPVAPPPHAFLQATPSGEAAIIAAVLAGLGKSRHVADLYAGCGTLSLPIAARAQVQAIDTAADALAALDVAARRSGRGPRVKTVLRDLTRRPLVEDELRGLDAVVFDPPREGAREQAASLARSDVPRVVAVSCNPASFARDAYALREGGYRLEQVTPIDQFLWSPHVELVAVFARPRRPRR